jgi:uncharacterized protein YggE
MAVEITVSETVEEFHRPERAVLSVQVSFDGPDKSGVRERTVTVADDIAAGLAGLLDAEHGPVTRYSRAGLATWADRPWNAQGQQLPPVHHATDRFSITFADFSVLADWLDRHAAVEGVAMTGIEWRLTRRRAEQVSAGVRSAAVQAARAKAQAYADSLELGPVRPVSIADQGMLTRDTGGDRPIPLRAMAAAGVDAAPAILPEDVRIWAVVDARFSVGD